MSLIRICVSHHAQHFIYKFSLEIAIFTNGRDDMRIDTVKQSATGDYSVRYFDFDWKGLPSYHSINQNGRIVITHYFSNVVIVSITRRLDFDIPLSLTKLNNSRVESIIIIVVVFPLDTTKHGLLEFLIQWRGEERRGEGPFLSFQIVLSTTKLYI